MRSNAPDVDSYLDEVPEKRREAVDALRDACQTDLKKFDESMEHGMPSYSRNGDVEVAFASQKQYIALYILRSDVVESHRHLLGDLDVGKSCIRYRKPEQIDLTIVHSMLQATAASEGDVC
jgi:uncharacterized protein YdhG (YjbR/CyaY superfamily)